MAYEKREEIKSLQNTIRDKSISVLQELKNVEKRLRRANKLKTIYLKDCIVETNFKLNDSRMLKYLKLDRRYEKTIEEITNSK